MKLTSNHFSELFYFIDFWRLDREIKKSASQSIRGHKRAIYALSASIFLLVHWTIWYGRRLPLLSTPEAHT